MPTTAARPVRSRAELATSGVRAQIGSLGPEICFERHGFTTFKADGSVLEQGKSLVIWKRVDGQWLAYIDIFNSNDGTGAS